MRGPGSWMRAAQPVSGGLMRAHHFVAGVGQGSRQHKCGYLPLAAVALAVMVSGCTVGLRHSADATSSPTPVSSSRAVTGQLLPIFKYLQSGAEANTYDRAYDIIVAQCMAKYGYNDPHQIFVEPPIPAMYRRYGVTSLEIASRWGYHLEPGSPLLAKRPAQQPQSAAETLVLTGSVNPPPQYSPFGNGKRVTFHGKLLPPGGCAGEAIIRLRAYGPDALQILPSQINQDDFTASMTKPQVVAVFRNWSRCMVARGFSYRDPLQAAARFNINTPSPSRKEIDTAVADVRCKNQTHLVAVWFGVESRLEEVSIRGHLTALAAIHAKLAQEERAALAVITSGR